MIYDSPLVSGRLLQRYKRFLADVRLDDGREVTAHCANTGSMLHCAEPGSRVWLRDSADPKRKLRYSWEWVEVAGRWRACINTARPNQLVQEALQQGMAGHGPLASLTLGYQLQREPKVEDGRLDFRLHSHAHQPDIWVEVKSVTLLNDLSAVQPGTGRFPDAVTARGLKHLQRLMAIVAGGERALLLFCVPHEGINRVQAAADIDPAYARALAQAAASGVEVLAFGVDFTHAGQQAGMTLSQPLPVEIEIIPEELL